MNAPFSDAGNRPLPAQRVFDSLAVVVEMLNSRDGVDDICRGDIEHDPLPSSTGWTRPAQLPTLPQWRRF